MVWSNGTDLLKQNLLQEGLTVCKQKWDVRNISIPYLALRYLDLKKTKSQYLKGLRENWHFQGRATFIVRPGAKETTYKSEDIAGLDDWGPAAPRVI